MIKLWLAWYLGAFIVLGAVVVYLWHPRPPCKQFWEGECVDGGLWIDPLANKLMPK